MRKAKEKVWRFCHQTSLSGYLPPVLTVYVFAFIIARTSLAQGNTFVNIILRLILRLLA
ncbi:hypothetical protein ACFLXG_04415 [Chloroflexota bacterium]